MWDPKDGRIPSQDPRGALEPQKFQASSVGSLHHTLLPLPPALPASITLISQQAKMRKEEEKEPEISLLHTSSLRARWAEGNYP